MTDVLIGALQQVLVTVLLAVLSLASAYAVFYIHRAKQRLQTMTDVALLDATIARAAALAESTVLAFEGTVAKELREAVKNGRADRSELLAVGQRAVQDVLLHLGTEGQKVLEQSVGDVENFIRDLVEAQVERLKQYPFGSSPGTSGASIQAI